jgi:hypothetical protein
MTLTLTAFNTRAFVDAVARLPRAISDRPLAELVETAPHLLENLGLAGVPQPVLALPEPDAKTRARILAGAATAAPGFDIVN